MGQKGFEVLFQRGEPLVDVVATFRCGIDVDAAVAQINASFEDFDLARSPHYDAQLRLGTASKAALERIFAWRIKRFPEEPGLGLVYGWVSVQEPDIGHSGLQHLFESIGMSQPGADDDGQWWA